MPVKAKFTLTDGRTGVVEADTREQALQAIEELQAQVVTAQQNAPATTLNDPRQAAVSIGSSMLAEPASGLAGIAGLVGGLVPGGESPSEKANRYLEATKDFVTVDPNPAAEKVVETVGNVAGGAAKAVRAPFATIGGGMSALSARTPEEARDRFVNTVGRVIDEGIGPVAGEKVADATGSPALGAAVAVVPEAILSLLGFRAHRLSKAGKTQLRQDISDTLRRQGLDPTDTSAVNLERMRTALREEVAAASSTDDVARVTGQASRQATTPGQPTTVGRPAPNAPVDVTPPNVVPLRPRVSSADVRTPAQPTTVGRPRLDRPVDVTPRAFPATTSDDIERAQRLLSAMDDAPEQVSGTMDDLAGQERRAAFDELGLEPTRAQITRSADDFQSQQELAKTSGKVRSALERQEGQLAGAFDDAVSGTGGSAARATSPVRDVILARSTELDSRIGRIYRRVRSQLGDDQVVDVARLVDRVDNTFASDRAMRGLPAAVRGNLKTRGIIDAKGNILRKVSVTEAEEIRAFMNDFFDSTSGAGRRAIRQFKSALDTDVFKASGRDAFREARQAKIDFERSLERAKVSKFDSARRNVVRDILENKIDPDHLTEKLVFSKTTRADDLRQVRDFLNQSDDGIRAFDDLRAETLQMIKEKAFVGPVDDNGFQALSRHQLERALNSIGDSKLEVLFSTEERALIDRLLNISKLREPVRGTALGRGPSAQAVGSLVSSLEKMPIFGNLIEQAIINQNAKVALKARP